MIENAERASIILISDFRKDILEQHFVAVAFIHCDILAIFSNLSEYSTRSPSKSIRCVFEWRMDIESV